MSARSLPLLPIGVLVVLLALTYWLSTFVQPQQTRDDANLRHDPDLIIEDFTAQKMSPAGDVQYVVKAAKMMHYPDDDSSEMNDVVFTANEPGQPTVVVRAPRGKINDGGDEVVMEGGVVLQSSAVGSTPALTVKTRRLTVLPDQGIARSVDGVTMESANGAMRAQKFEMNSKTKIATFEKGSLSMKLR